MVVENTVEKNGRRPKASIENRHEIRREAMCKVRAEKEKKFLDKSPFNIKMIVEITQKEALPTLSQLQTEVYPSSMGWNAKNAEWKKIFIKRMK